MSYEGKIALVTGASRGIGQAIALALAQHGATVLGTATTEAGAESISEYFRAAKVKGQGYQLNVTDQDSVTHALAQIKEQHGDPLILVNNAAITRDNLLLRMKDDEWDSVIDTNLTSIFKMTKACIRPMMKARWGRVISISSIVGSTGNPGQANYAASKAAILGFSKSLAQEIASRGITINVVAPGFINTDMTRSLSDDLQENLVKQIPMGRIGDPKEIAHAVDFLIRADYVTGQTLHINGGMFMN